MTGQTVGTGTGGVGDSREGVRDEKGCSGTHHILETFVQNFEDSKKGDSKIIRIMVIRGSVETFWNTV